MNETILIAIIIIFIYIFLFHNKKNVVLVSTSNNNKYLVYNDDKKQQTAEILEKLIDNIFTLRNYLYENKENFPDMKPYINMLYRNLDKNKTLIYENDPKSNLTSYSINKGEELCICLRSKKTGEIHDINLLTYVLLHEISHIACPEVGHGELFKKIFRFITEQAIEIGIYTKENYEYSPVEYCGMMLSSSII